MWKFFPEAELEDLKRTERFELLSHREGRLAPQRVRVVGDLVLWDSPLGKTVGGAHPDLIEEVDVTAWRSETHFNQDEEIGEYIITRVNMGDRPAGCIVQVAMWETARLPMFSGLEEERRVLEEDGYMDDILTPHSDPERLDKTIKGVEEILRAGGFFLKPWTRRRTWKEKILALQDPD